MPCCHTGLNEGWIKWDDEDDNNRNIKSGSLPEGSYTRDTNIEYCCRTDGFAENEIHLPTSSPFFLLKSQSSHQCQKVKDMEVNSEYFKWDTEDKNSSNDSGGSIPYGEVGKDIKLYYCYYYIPQK